MDLGARPGQVFWLVTLPMITQSLMSAWLLTFTISLDDVVLSAFLSGPGATTMPLVIFSRARLGLNPSVHQSGEGRPRHGRITKQGRTHARTMLVEAAWQAVRGPGPLRAFYQRIARRRGNHIAAVAVARKLAVKFVSDDPPQALVDRLAQTYLEHDTAINARRILHLEVEVLRLADGDTRVYKGLLIRAAQARGDLDHGVFNGDPRRSRGAKREQAPGRHHDSDEQRKRS